MGLQGGLCGLFIWAQPRQALTYILRDRRRSRGHPLLYAHTFTDSSQPLPSRILIKDTGHQYLHSKKYRIARPCITCLTW